MEVISRYPAARTMIRFFPSLYVRYVKMTERCDTTFPTCLTFPKNSQVSDTSGKSGQGGLIAMVFSNNYIIWCILCKFLKIYDQKEGVCNGYPADAWRSHGRPAVDDAESDTPSKEANFGIEPLAFVAKYVTTSDRLCH